MIEKLLEIGDKIQVIPRLGKPWISTIIKVTKNKAIGDIPGNTSGTMEFYRSYKDPEWIRRKSSDPYEMVDYKLLKNN